MSISECDFLLFFMYCIVVICKWGLKLCFVRELNVLNCFYDFFRDDIEILLFGEVVINFFYNECILMNLFLVFLLRLFYVYFLCYEYLYDFVNESRLMI